MIGVDDKYTILRKIVDEAARSLSAVRHDEDASYLRTPVMYPGGSMVVIRVAAVGAGSGPSADRFIVSDMGLGRQEADLMGAAPLFARWAPKVAERAGVSFDHRDFFLMEVARPQLAGAVATIAACSQEAVQLTAFKLAERRQQDATERLYERLVTVFSRDRVAKDVEVLGASNTPWHVATLVSADGHKAVFEPVANHPTAIAAAVTKFFDIAQLENGPARIAVVRNKEAFGTKLAVIAGAAKVVDESIPDAALHRLAEAA
ncbi:hypothetical protein SAMN02982917_2587 [Azospirillum oryzae]|uniref:DUF1828 domain-containing protein n=1 Tax=Azospirillum oryzae TaxID=286727 RepID=A0A1X7FDZ2_9PROT|nr:hypothetical protein SAMN02982917_2587 [Azospirillum oryzae]